MQVDQDLYRNFEMRFPNIAERVIDIYNGMPFELVMTLSDGTTMAYFDIDETIRRLPGDGSNMSYNECAVEFGIRLWQIMRIRCMSQKGLAIMTGITESSICNYIRGKIMPNFYNVDKIARALDCSVEDLRYVYKNNPKCMC